MSLIPMILSLKRNNKDEQEVKTLIEELVEKLRTENTLNISETTWQVILSILCYDEAFYEQAVFWFKNTKERVNYSDQILQKMFKLLLRYSDDIMEMKYICEKMSKPNIVLFTEMVKNLLCKDEITRVMNLLETMKMKPDDVLFGIIICYCSEHKLLREGIHLHALIKKLHISSVLLDSILIKFYTHCGNAERAIELYRDIISQNGKVDIITFTCVIQAFAELKQIEGALDALKEMKRRNIKPNSITFTVLISLCAENQFYKEGLKLHEMIKALNLSSLELTHSLLNFYTKCDQPDTALQIFQELKLENKTNVISWTCAIQAFVHKKDIHGAINLLEEMQINNIKPDQVIFTILIGFCAEHQLYEEGVILHEILRKLNIQSLELSNSLMNFYSKCNKYEISLQIFEERKKEKKVNSTSCNNAMQTLIKQGTISKITELLDWMVKNHIIDFSSLIAVTNMFAERKLLNEGILLHQQLITKETENIWSNSLMRFYIKCDKPALSLQLFEKLKRESKANVKSWNLAIRALVQMNDITHAFDLLKEMKIYHSLTPDIVTFVSLISLCSRNNLYEEGLKLHEAIKSLNLTSLELSHSLMNFYTKCEQPDTALQIFQELKDDNKTGVISWTCAIQALGKKKDTHCALDLLEEMNSLNIKPDSVIFNILITLCAENHLYEDGVKLHETINVMIGIENLELNNCLLNFYLKCGQPNNTLRLFEEYKQGNKINTVSWNIAIQALLYKEEIKASIEFLMEMQLTNFKPDTITFRILLGFCAEMKYYKEGVKIHRIIKDLNIQNLEVSHLLMNFYTKCGQPDISLQLFDQLRVEKINLNVISWTCAIQALGEKNDIHGALEFFEEMQHNNIKTDSTLLNILLSLCSENQMYEEGVKLHETIKSLRISSLELSNCLMNFYNKFGKVNISLEIFEELKRDNLANIVSWNNAIQALRTMKDVKKALEFQKEMKLLNIELDEITYVNLLTICADKVAIKHGEDIVKEFEAKDNAKSSYWIGAMMNFYGKVGNLMKAEEIFKDYLEKSPSFDSILTSIMIDAYAKHGKGNEAVVLYQQIIERNQIPTTEAITSVLIGCSHAGLVEEARKVYNSIENTQVWTQSHKACMVDVLSRSGYLDEAEMLIGSSRDKVCWISLLGACRNYSNLEIAERAFEILLEIGREQASHYVQMSHIYNQLGQLEKAKKVRELMKQNNAKKDTGLSTIEINGETHSFESDDSTHPRILEINQELDKLTIELKESGYIPDTRWFTRLDVEPSDEKTKAKLLSRHSERIAMAFAFIYLPKDEPIVMRKNLRMCGDCHTVTKMISKIRKREIIVRDSTRYHHFKDGKCSCGDFF